MSLARARAILESSGSTARGRALGSILWRASSTSTAIRVSSAPIWVLGSAGGGGPAGGASVAQPARVSAAKRRKASRRIIRLMGLAWNNLEQAGRAHATPDAHGDHAKLG